MAGSCEAFAATTYLTPGGIAYVLVFTMNAPRAILSEVLKETTMYGAITYTYDSLA